MKSTNKKGFTILELMVSVAIIAILTSIILVTISGIKERSRDVRRLSDVNEIQKALNLYFSSHNIFPVFPVEINITGDDAFSEILISEKNMPAVPTDPLPTYGAYTYQSNSGGTNYSLGFCMETNTVSKYLKGCTNTLTP
ncbi:MAG: putative General secretion pathway protein GspG [Parcubacteria group bacterium Athens0714_16]|nr:MAG: putative General secretion pathway protein GspG [Parcubacteria group bacterium Athens0714_16]